MQPVDRDGGLDAAGRLERLGLHPGWRAGLVLLAGLAMLAAPKLGPAALLFLFVYWGLLPLRAARRGLAEVRAGESGAPAAALLVRASGGELLECAASAVLLVLSGFPSLQVLFGALLLGSEVLAGAVAGLLLGTAPMAGNRARALLDGGFALLGVGAVAAITFGREGGPAAVAGPVALAPPFALLAGGPGGPEYTGTAIGVLVVLVGLGIRALTRRLASEGRPAAAPDSPESLPVLAFRVVVALLACALLAPAFLDRFAPRHGGGEGTACRFNLRNIGTALELYSTDFAGRYPTALSQLTPEYLRAVPTCPSAGRDTYSDGYRSAAFPDAYTVACEGDLHGLGEGLPEYNSRDGLVERRAAP